VRPGDAVKLDYEVELAAVIGRDARYVDEVHALDHAAGYCIVSGSWPWKPAT
jgi:2-keto-4-pentenoate hydratase/2-oxohepta-3-ene-1,7-dioic acid hydratase in catechol pathway